MRSGWLLALTVLLSLALYGGLKAFRGGSVYTPEKIQTLHEPSCDPSRETCSVSLDSVLLRIQLLPAGLPAMEPLTLQVGVESPYDIQLLSAWFEGRDMDMGRHELASSHEYDEPDVMTLRGVIPVCSVNPKMVWQLKMRWKIRNTQQLLVFDLASDAKRKLIR